MLDVEILLTLAFMKHIVDSHAYELHPRLMTSTTLLKNARVLHYKYDRVHYYSKVKLSTYSNEYR